MRQVLFPLTALVLVAGGLGGCDEDEVCGDGAIADNESCDDGNIDGGDGCSITCTVEAGYGCFLPSVGESSRCTTVCGDGVKTSDEDCDDGNIVDGDGCTDTCMPEPARCGDGHVNEGEGCDDRNDSNEDDCVEGCARASCGDGFVHAEVEQCDDGNDVDTDACVSDCKEARCGDGVVQEGMEQCDPPDGEACGADCQPIGPVECPTPIDVSCQSEVTGDLGPTDPNVLAGTACAGVTFDGSERVYRLFSPVQGVVNAFIAGASATGYVLADDGTCNPSACVAADIVDGMFWNAMEGASYLIVVEATGSYTLSVGCPN